MAAGISTSRMGLGRALAVSLGAHGLPLLIVLGLTSLRFAVPAPEGEPLRVELFGMVTNQQTRGERAAAPMAAKQAQAAQRSEAPQPQAKPDPDSVAAKMPERQLASAATPNQQASEGQTQQTTSKGETEASLTRRFLAEVSRIVHGHLLYPVKARAKGLTGVTYVAFTVTEGGGIVSGSEAVHRSSGYEDLDQAALASVRSVDHWPQPPRRMQVVVAVNFAKNG